MRTDDFDYRLPPERIAQTPVEPRDAARLLVDRGTGAPPQPEHHHVWDLPSLLRPGDLVIVNDTRVLPARLHLQRSTGGRVELLLLEAIDDAGRCWEALARPARRLRAGERLVDARGEEAVEVGGRRDEAVEVRLLGDEDARLLLERLGQVPLPPYIEVPLADAERYQTVYAARPASVASPTAGLHLTDGVLGALADRGIGIARLELVVGLDTFKPMAVDDVADHVMHSERYDVGADVIEQAMATRAQGGRVVAVGTTAVRALESAARGTAAGRTSLFIRRPFDWRVVDVLLTNFHLPRSTLLVLLDAFVGPRWRDLYAVALAEGYRFLSFGDAMLVERSA